MTSPRSQIIDLLEQRAIPKENIAAALRTAKITPDGQAWRSFIDQILLWLGGLALAFSCLFFIAYNWNDFGRFAKFGMVETLLLLSIIVYWKLGTDRVTGKVSLLVASILLGVLLALYGQTYQTGADPWQLFFTWAILLLPWAMISRFAAIWILWVALLNLSLVLYHQTFGGILWFPLDSGPTVLWLLFLLNTAALFLWELLGNICHWRRETWAIRLLALASGIPITLLSLYSIVASGSPEITASLVWLTWLAVLYFVYRSLRHDLFMLAGACLSGIVVIVAFVSRQILQDISSIGFLLLALLVIGLGTAAAIWLRNIHRTWQS